MVLKRVYVSTSKSVCVIYNLSKELLDSLLLFSVVMVLLLIFHLPLHSSEPFSPFNNLTPRLVSQKKLM